MKHANTDELLHQADEARDLAAGLVNALEPEQKYGSQKYGGGSLPVDLQAKLWQKAADAMNALTAVVKTLDATSLGANGHLSRASIHDNELRQPTSGQC